MAKMCEWCGGKLDVLRPGRIPTYCTTRCRVAAHRSRRNAIPAELRERDRWVLWSPIRRRGRTTKMPLRLDGRPASSTEQTTWGGYESVRDAERKGFVLGGGIGCIDLDHCLVDGRPTPDVERYLIDTYIEVSPSGDGLHVWGWLPEGPGRRRGGVEVYSAGRYMTVTGKRFSGTSRLADLSKIVGGHG